MTDQPIIVKFVGRGSDLRFYELWRRQFPGGEPRWGRCVFLLDRDADAYDWLVVYDDLPPLKAERFSTRRELLACPTSRTLLVTTEPSSIRFYGRRYLAQFGHVLSSQEPEVVRHSGLIHAQPALRWFYGVGADHVCTWDEMAAYPPLEKTRTISTVCSSKRHRHTLHRRRVNFTHELRSLLPELDVFGHGVRAMNDKAEALGAYRYHVAVENHIALHHWTEKLADAFLGCTLPFYFGCPNAASYFPADSFIPIDIARPREAAGVIREAIKDDEYTRRLPAILEARRLVLEQYNLPAVLSTLIEQRHDGAGGSRGAMLLSRAAMRRRAPLSAVSDWFCKVRLRAMAKALAGHTNGE